ncbi:MAG: molybdopterin-dependent oxidoreductase [Actinobacteria bacterium]|nr:molybdopterin-dependent oxidoreductase [Actinomycetota bacterium]
MKTKYVYPILLVILVLAAATASPLISGCQSSKNETAEKDSREAEVTAVEDMRVRTAEDAPEIDAATYRLEVTGLVNSPLTLTYDEIRSLPAEKRLVDLPCVEGWSETARWKGPRLQEILDRAGAKENATTAVFYSPGGYSTSLAITDIGKTDPLLAYEVNGETLPPDQGFPVRLVVPDKLGYKWIKWVDRIELIEGDHEGYWEQRGYPNEADTEGR